MPQKVQAIAGLHSSSECEIAVRYPSIASTGVGRFLGALLECIPIKIWGVKISYLLFGLAVAPIAALWYLALKGLGERYVLSNRSVSRWASIGHQRLQSVPVVDIADVVVQQQPGQGYYDAGDVYLMNAKGDPLMVLHGVSYPEIMKANILETRDAEVSVLETQKVIAARQPA